MTPPWRPPPAGPAAPPSTLLLLPAPPVASLPATGAAGAAALGVDAAAAGASNTLLAAAAMSAGDGRDASLQISGSGCEVTSGTGGAWPTSEEPASAAAPVPVGVAPVCCLMWLSAPSSLSAEAKLRSLLLVVLMSLAVSPVSPAGAASCSPCSSHIMLVG